MGFTGKLPVKLLQQGREAVQSAKGRPAGLFVSLRMHLSESSAFATMNKCR
jgi:hypothetical protein